MTEQEQAEERNKRIGLVTSLSVQLVLLVLCYLIIAWREPDPPIPEYGIELSFSTSAGATSSETTNTAAEAQEKSDPDAETKEDVEPMEDAEAVESENDLQTKPETTENLATEKPSEASEEVQEVIQEAQEVPQPVKQQASEEVDQMDAAEKKEEEPNEVQQETNEEPQKPVVNSKALMGTQQGEKKAESNESSEQIVDKRAIYGSGGGDSGSTDGAQLSLAGWKWDTEPRPEDDSQETGKIIYKIKVDSEGYLRGVELELSTVSPAVQNKYREAVQKLTFSKTEKYKAASFSEGRITFIITTK